MLKKGTFEELLLDAAKNMGLAESARQVVGNTIQNAFEATGLPQGASRLAGTFHLMMQEMANSAGSLISVLPPRPKFTGNCTDQYRPTAANCVAK